MATITPRYKPMSLDQAVNSRMDKEAFEAYLNLHEVYATRRDD